jgi:UDP-glucose:(heptosyl)LPS alpha-1,3-glucosyltransferase
MIAQELLEFYPKVERRLCMPAYPGVSDNFSFIGGKSVSGAVGFIGRVWKRKGL